ncbi:transmembrane protein, putative (macronuclear) [Tetrahymena thermophila SB210]|uniref:Transmembrane protein, putative n=1 Tax=Tetrahymena thermophila (strain SB210) TaxID=312017 RepID=W7XHR4_TETTS|nr:transmembrane protein, putative [Tetrahymena thermophila SB210]EWS72704.1 transmembrane protein, putative [Tetrahymena thermophila SB210]|eukprot:XP_012654780.1 transmembrane protein, putative [Tetrahymena thermophila SB210]
MTNLMPQTTHELYYEHCQLYYAYQQNYSSQATTTNFYWKLSQRLYQVFLHNIFLLIQGVSLQDVQQNSQSANQLIFQFQKDQSNIFQRKLNRWHLKQYQLQVICILLYLIYFLQRNGYPSQIKIYRSVTELKQLQKSELAATIKQIRKFFFLDESRKKQDCNQIFFQIGIFEHSSAYKLHIEPKKNQHKFILSILSNIFHECIQMNLNIYKDSLTVHFKFLYGQISLQHAHYYEQMIQFKKQLVKIIYLYFHLLPILLSIFDIMGVHNFHVIFATIFLKVITRNVIFKTRLNFQKYFLYIFMFHLPLIDLFLHFPHHQSYIKCSQHHLFAFHLNFRIFIPLDRCDGTKLSHFQIIPNSFLKYLLQLHYLHQHLKIPLSKSFQKYFLYHRQIIYFFPLHFLRSLLDFYLATNQLKLYLNPTNSNSNCLLSEYQLNPSQFSLKYYLSAFILSIHRLINLKAVAYSYKLQEFQNS